MKPVVSSAAAGQTKELQPLPMISSVHTRSEHLTIAFPSAPDCNDTTITAETVF